MTPTEKILSELCKGSFLSFWSFPNPFSKKGKELCDLLVVCDPDIIIFSVKDISIKESGDLNVDIDRWLKRAIESSSDQIYGAERIINLKEEIFLCDQTTKIKLPEKGIRNIYRVAVAFGRGDKFPLKYGDFGKGFIHVFDEKSIHILLRELDTITDFTDYLKAKEEFLKSGTGHISFSSEDMLALYIQNGFSFPDSDETSLYLFHDLWEGYSNSDEYLKEKEENEPSYLWDSIIETLHKDFENGQTIYSESREEIELSVRQMNKENRFGRRQLSKCLQEVIGQDDGIKTPSSRIVKAQLEGSPVYVFLARPFEQREDRLKELQLTCMIGRQMHMDASVIIGIATEKYKKDKGFSLDICYFHLPEWTKEMEEKTNQIREELGIYKNPQRTRISPDGTKYSD
ncbi:MAG: hypothetical protein SFV55_06865 [Haliscomenobacter sp.]|uniref:hypothetical protein n=1 Tax=Haliscomenobacter sp. TaxID=2717303 RepID=UPI0029B588FB|nr:hypothetical protein [Haliscomenobacter sp.]MDX2068130.1 hypothetical protein [Haliscomenobacter sp.]